MDEPSEQYLSHLLRLWRTGVAGEWQGSLEAPVSGERLGFPNLDALFDYLRTQAPAGITPPDEERGGGEPDGAHQQA
jgi:hypothetical protein